MRMRSKDSTGTSQPIEDQIFKTLPPNIFAGLYVLLEIPDPYFKDIPN